MIIEDKKEKMTPSPLVGEGRGEGLKHQTLSRICKLAFGSLTNSTPVLKLLHAHRVSPKLLRNRRLNLFAIRINSLSLNHPSAISLSQRERVRGRVRNDKDGKFLVPQYLSALVPFKISLISS